MKIACLMVLALLGTAYAERAQADNFRCGKWLATPDLAVPDLLARCGEPVSREVRTEDVLVRNYNTGLMFKNGERTIELWTYDRGANASPMVVTIVDGRIESIERKPST